MNFILDDTIAAIASAPGAALRGIIRVSGPDVMQVLQRVLKTTSMIDHQDRLPRRLAIQIPVADGTLQLPGHLFYWPTTRSFTGEVLAELHLPGSPPLLNEVLEQVLVSGARPAERGEFTLRAFLAGRIDLVQAEAVLGVIDAGNSHELETALTQLAGGISGRIALLREQLLLHLADLEAGLDFVEEDIEFVEREELKSRLDVVRELLVDLLEQSSERMQSSGHVRVVLAGLPNAGKSTLFNCLIGRQAALVSEVAGTTRDYLSASLSHAGIDFDLIDTAGWESARDGIEAAAGVLRDEQYQRANLILWCSAADLNPSERAADRAVLELCRQQGPDVFFVQTKSDSVNSFISEDEQATVRVSAQQGEGIQELLTEIAAKLSATGDSSEMINSTAARCSESLRHALLGVERARESIDFQAGDELIALELREVLDHLGRIVGQVHTDDILDRIFSRFCIGK